MSALQDVMTAPSVRCVVSKLSGTRGVLAFVALAALAALAACGQKEGGAQGPGAGAPPPAEVGVIVVAPQPVGLATELPGRTEASRVAQVRARAAGILLKRLFVEGSDVKAGQR